MIEAFNLNLDGFKITKASEAGAVTEEASTAGSLLSYYTLGFMLMLVYLAGCLYKGGRLLESLYRVYRLISHNKQTNAGNYTLIHTRENLTPFSFLHYVFLHQNAEALDEEELTQVLHHEQIHVAQKHTFDILLFEIGAVFFWFNPAMYYLNRQIREVHEYQVDSTLIRARGNIKKYGELLIKLATQQTASPIMNPFSSKQILNRITMLTQTKSSLQQKLKLLFALPLIGLTLLLCSFLGSKNQNTLNQTQEPASIQTATSQKGAPIRKISWVGNKAYTDAQLNKVLGLSKGDKYSKEDLESRLNYHPSGKDVSSLYMDNGYLFFSVSPKEVMVKDGVELELVVEEGPQARIGRVSIEGNTKVSTAELLEKINIISGELFSRSKLIKAQQNVLELGHFNPEKFGIKPIPNIEAGIVDIEFTVEEI